jgi:hypothetical protein
MCLLSVGLETVGLLLRVWLWISVPMAVIILLVATYFNYLRNARAKGMLKLAVEGWGGEVAPGGGESYIGRDEVTRGGEAISEEAEAELGETGKETIYRGILWMKEKYEQYREQADRRYEQLREALGRSEQRYQELLAVMEQRSGEMPGLLSAKQAIIDELEAQLRSERMKVEELVLKLQQESIPDLGKTTERIS